MDLDEPKEMSQGAVVPRRIEDWVRQASRFLLGGLCLVVIGFLGGLIIRNGVFWLLFALGAALLLLWLMERYGDSIHLGGSGRETRSFSSVAVKERPVSTLDEGQALARSETKGWGLTSVIGREDRIEWWHLLIADAQGRADVVFQDAQQFLAASRPPDVKLEAREVSSGLFRGLLGGRRPFLVVTNATRPNLKPFRMYINARDYGNNLQVSWYLMFKLGFWRKLLLLLTYVPGINFLLFPFILMHSMTQAKEAGMVDLDIFDLQDLTAYVTNTHHCLLEAVTKLMIELNQDPSKVDRKSRGFLGIS